jgi:hypothetical protein
MHTCKFKHLHDAFSQTIVLKITRENQYIISQQLPQAELNYTDFPAIQ